jgi:fatty acid/phospholipid biosynthesis enzyme
MEKENVIEYGGFVELNDAPNIENIDTFFKDTCKEVGAIVSKNIELTTTIMNDILKVTKRKRLAKKIAIELVKEGYKKEQI